jgi:ABC-type transport system substrate-binding protein
LIRINPGIHYQPHPAFAQDEAGHYRYHQLALKDLERINVLGDFSETGSRELTAEDYVYQIKRIAFPKLHSPIASLMQDYILGFEPFSETLTEAYQELQEETGEKEVFLDLRNFSLQGVELLDRYSYRVRLQGKYPQFVYWLAMPFFAPMPWEADRFYTQPGMPQRNITLNWYPVGTGPYMLSENNPNLRMVLERNPNFHDDFYPTEGNPGQAEQGLLDDAGKRVPFIDKAIYSLEKETIPYWNKFLQGYYDNSGISSDSFDQAVQFTDLGEAELTGDMRAKGIRLSTTVRTSNWYMGFNMADPVVGGDSERSRLLRRAISIAVDFEEFISIFANGRGVVAQGMLPPGIYGHKPGLAGINPYVYRVVDDKAVRRDMQEAQQLMAQAGYPDGRDAATGKPLVLYYDTAASGPDSKAQLNWMRKQFAKLGVQLVIRATDFNRFQDKMRKGTEQIFMWGWNADYPDPENFLFLLYGPHSKIDNNGENASNYKNPQYDALFEQMKNMDNGAERQAIIDQMMEILRRDAPWSWGYFPKAFSLHHAWYQNSIPNLMADNTLKYKRIDPQLRVEKRQGWNQPVLWPVIALLVMLLISLIPAYVMFRRSERSSAI